ncbi:voltage-dependent anion channel-domain-containing protein [Paecilomyces variotii]|uniref:Voltage-dependent anion channel-domain-containing protein n=1 Tax=Byssochlamys spectabilis TaxID=264951 RepID=A0A443HHH0_BYSSP|nr:voltage-dependent anion channel-domain-containing protein [Paecilomyces variotii]RWQ91217.1 voltage-dependent anion channel-domain-containing protein [Paecilomyces variotii]
MSLSRFWSAALSPSICKWLFFILLASSYFSAHLNHRLWTHGIKSSVMTTSGLFPFLAPIVSASSGGVIAEVLSSERQITQTAITSYILWSIGILPAMAFIILYVYNILETNMPPKEHIVSLALPTGPFGYGAFGLMRLGEIGDQLLLGTRSGGNFLQDRIGSRPPFLGVWVVVVPFCSNISSQSKGLF